MDWEGQYFDPVQPGQISTTEVSNEVGKEPSRSGKVKWAPNPKIVNYATRTIAKYPVVKIADLGTACWTHKHFTGINN